MNITIVSVGKLKEKYLKQGIDEYAKRLGSYCKFQVKEAEKFYQENQQLYYDENGRVFDLQKISDSHFVALNPKGGK